MLLTLFTTTGLVVWLVLWSIGAKGFDAFLLTVLLMIIGVTVKLVVSALSPRSEET